MKWDSIQFFAKLIDWGARTLNAFYLTALIGSVFFPGEFWSSMPVSTGQAAIFLIFFGSISAVILIIENKAKSPDLLRKKAGLHAENYVKNILEKKLNIPGSKSIHNKLFVFNKNATNEFSVEADHILITPSNIYLIETKYKSGTVYARPDTDEWSVRTARGEEKMRNALKQVKSTAKTLGQHLQLPKQIIPIVAIYGKDIQVVDNPGNVDTADKLTRIILAFEKSTSGVSIVPETVAQTLQSSIASDSLSLQRHIARIDETKMRKFDERVVSSSSLD